jgi:hypothetical protein
MFAHSYLRVTKLSILRVRVSLTDVHAPQYGQVMLKAIS